MTTQYLTNERGEKVAVVISIADYEELLEDVADLACVAERRDEERISLAELKEQLVTPDPPPVPAVMTATTSTRSRSLAPGQALGGL